MGRPHPIELRERVQGEIASGRSRRASTERFKVSASFAVKLAARVARTGSAEPARQGRPPGNGKLAPYLVVLLEWVEAESDVTMPELAAKLLAEKGLRVHPASLSRVLIQAGLSFKKTLAKETERAEVVQARHDWKARRQPLMREENHRLAFLDETGTNSPARTYSWTSFDMLEQVAQGTNTATFTYTPERQRLTQTTSTGVTLYANDPAGRVMSERFAGGFTIT